MMLRQKFAWVPRPEQIEGMPTGRTLWLCWFDQCLKDCEDGEYEYSALRRPPAFSFYRRKEVRLGEGLAVQHTIFECKNLFSIRLYNWKTIAQDRFHTHAFPALCFTLSGSYEEESGTEVDGVMVFSKKRVRKLFLPRFLPKNYFHRILAAEENTWTLVLEGPWIRCWWEYFRESGRWIMYDWSRRRIGEVWENS